MKKDSQIELEDVTEATARDQAREFVINLLEQGFDPQHIAEAMTYSAVEMSLQFADNKLCVVPILMDSMSRATRTYLAYQAEQNNAEIRGYLTEATNSTFH